MAEKTTQDLAERKTQVYNLLTKNVSKTVGRMLSNVKDVDRYMLAAYNAACKVPALLDATQASLVTCIVEAAQLNLDIGGPLGHAHLVPFYDGKRKCMVAQLVIGFRGYQELAYRTGRVSSFDIHPVHAKDHFTFRYGTGKTLEHVPNMDEERGPLVAAYACVMFTNGGFDFEVVGPADAKRAMKSSKGAWYSDGNPNKNSPWHQPDNVGEMWCKTAVRRLAKRLPFCAELELAAQYEAAQDTEGVQPVIDVEAVEELQPQDKAQGEGRTGQVADALKAKNGGKPADRQEPEEDPRPAGPDLSGMDIKAMREVALDYWLKTGFEAEDADRTAGKSLPEWTRQDCERIIGAARTQRFRMAEAGL